MTGRSPGWPRRKPSNGTPPTPIARPGSPLATTSYPRRLSRPSACAAPCRPKTSPPGSPAFCARGAGRAGHPLHPATVSDRTDGKIAHLDGLISVAPGAGAGSPRPCRRATRLASAPWPPPGLTWPPACPTWPATIWASTGWRASPCWRWRLARCSSAARAGAAQTCATLDHAAKLSERVARFDVNPMQKLILNLGAAASILAAMPASAADMPPDTQPGADLIWLLCTVSARQMSDNCRYTGGIEGEEQRVKAGSILGYLDAHPFPIPGGAVGSDAARSGPADHHRAPGPSIRHRRTRRCVRSASRTGDRDPAWVYSPYNAWAVAFTPKKAAHSAVSGEAGRALQGDRIGRAGELLAGARRTHRLGFRGSGANAPHPRADEAASRQRGASRGPAHRHHPEILPDSRYQPCLYEGVETMCKVE